MVKLLCFIFLFFSVPIFAVTSSPLANKSLAISHYFIDAQRIRVSDDINHSGYQSQLNILDSNAELLAVTDRRLGYKLAVGLMFNNNISLEIGWLDLGNTSLKFSTSAPDKIKVIERSKAIYPATGEGGYAALAYHYQISDQFSWKNSAGLWFFSQPRDIYLAQKKKVSYQFEHAGLIIESALHYQLFDDLFITAGVGFVPLKQVKAVNLRFGVVWNWGR